MGNKEFSWSGLSHYSAPSMDRVGRFDNSMKWELSNGTRTLSENPIRNLLKSAKFRKTGGTQCSGRNNNSLSWKFQHRTYGQSYYAFPLTIYISIFVCLFSSIHNYFNNC